MAQKTPASKWTTVLSSAELEAHYALTAKLYPAFARGEREFYEGRTESQLRVLAVQSWDCCDPDGYQMAQSYLAARGVV